MADCILCTSGIYQILNTNNGKMYVGSAINIAARWKTHQSHLRNGKHHSKHLQSSWDRHGESAFSFTILQAVKDAAHLLQCEDEWIQRLKSADRSRGYNICLRAGSQLGMRHSAEARQKISAANKGKAKTPEHQAAINEALRGRRLSDDHCKKIAKNQTGRKASDQTRQKMREANSDRKSTLSPEAYERMVTANVGRKFSDEHRARIAEANRRRTATPETKEKIRQARARTIAMGYALKDRLARGNN